MGSMMVPFRGLCLELSQKGATKEPMGSDFSRSWRGVGGFRGSRG